MNKKIPAPAIGEIVFDLAYLLFALVAGFVLLGKNGGALTDIYGALALVLVFGDAFHLLPRIYCLATGTMAEHTGALGFGKLITSVTMTIFYILLYIFWQRLYGVQLPIWLNAAVFSLGIIRIAICCFPQNGWLSKTPSYRFSIYRNIPFAALGGVVAALFAYTGITGAGGFRFMAPAIILSFAFYLPVVLWAGKNKKLGMLMMPKTCTYIWMICMGFFL